MPQYEKSDLNCENDLKQDIPEESDDSAEDFDLDEEINSYLNQLEEIPIELSEENCGDSSDGAKGLHNVLTETSKAASRNTPEYPASVSLAATENTESAASISSFIAKTVFNVLQQKKQEEEKKLSVGTVSNRLTAAGSNSEEDLSSAIFRQLIPKSKEKISRANKVKNKYQGNKEETSEERSLSAFLIPNRIIKSRGKTVLAASVKGISKSKTNSHKNKKSKRRREKKKMNYNNKSVSNRSRNIINMQISRLSTPALDGMITDIFPGLGASPKSEMESSVALKSKCSGSNEDDKTVVSLDIINTESNFIKTRRDSCSSSSSLSSRETVILPLRDPRLPHLKQELQLASLKTSELEHVSSSESLLLSTDSFCTTSQREPSPFPISEPVSGDGIENKGHPSLLKFDCSKNASDCSKLCSETDIGDNESDYLLIPEKNRHLRKSHSKDEDSHTVYYCSRRSSHASSQLKSGLYRKKREVLQSKVTARRRSCSGTPPPCTVHSASKLSLLRQKSLTPSPPIYSRSKSIGQRTEEPRTLTYSRSNSPVKAETELSKPEDKGLESDPVHSSKPAGSTGNKLASVSPRRSIINYRSLSPVSSDSGPRARTRSGSRRPRKSWKSQSRSPCRSRRKSRSVSPCRRRWKYQRSHSSSRSPQRRRMRSRSPRRRGSKSLRKRRSRSPCKTRSRSRRRRSRSPWRARSRSPRRTRSISRSPVGIKYLKSKSRSRKSRSPRRGSRKHRKRFSSPSSLSLSPPSSFEKRIRLKEQTEIALTSLVAAINGDNTAATALSVPQSHHAPVATTSCTVPSAALPAQMPIQVQLANTYSHCHCRVSYVEETVMG
jgi:hypothetical protein